MEGGGIEEPGEKPSGKGENQQQTQPSYGTGPESSHISHIGGSRALSPLRCPPIQRHWSAKLGKAPKKNFIHVDKAIENALALYLEVSEEAYLRDPCTELQHH